MARARSGSTGAAWAWALTVVGTGFFIFLILFVVTYTQNSKYQQEAQEAKDELEKFANSAQRSSPSVKQIESNLTGRETVVFALQEDVKQLKSMITVDSELPVSRIRDKKVDEMKVGSTLFKEVEDLRAQLAGLSQELDSAKAEQAKAEGRAQAAMDERDQLAGKFKTDLEQVAAGFDATGAKLSTAASGYDAMAKKLREEMEQTRTSLQGVIDDRSARIEELEAEIAELRVRLAQCEQNTANVVGPPDVEPADARIISLGPDGRQVYINRGAEDKLQLGMTFEVFSADELIKRNDYNELRGKATIEILDLEPQTALARVVRQRRGEAINPDDQVANLIYDPNAIYKFHVYGDFDVDSLGATSTRDRERIKSMITRWGGELSDDLNWDVDFLVLGKEPPLPDPLPENEFDPVKIREHAEATRNYETYNRLANQARELSVPVLNQNRFLALVGYYRR